MPDGLYERDTLAWSEQQADLLRRLAAGERVNDAVDWPNVIEEVHDVGNSQLRACESLLRQAMLHLLKLHAQPDVRSVPHWRSEVLAFLLDAESCFTPSMRQRLDLARPYEKAVYQIAASQDGNMALKSPVACPFEIDDLLSKRPDVDTLLRMLNQPQG